MQLRELISDFSYRVIKGNLDVEIESFTCDSKRICQGCLFVCIHGHEHDGHNFIKDALECQAAVLVTERLSDSIISLCYEKSSSITIILVANTKKALAWISARFYGNPADEMIMIGITGTKGKTTTAHMLQSIFQNANVTCGLIGTNGWTVLGMHHSLSHTTPSAPELHHILAQMRELGCTHVVMEVSSIGVKEQRVHGILFQYGIYTNLFWDHIGGKEHDSFKEYKYWKKQFFKQCEKAILNRDDKYWKEMKNTCQKAVISYDVKQEIIHNESCFGSEMEFCWKKQKQTVFVPLPGIINCANALAAMYCAACCNIDLEKIAFGIRKTVVKGRMELVCNKKDISIFIDYAHNGDSLRYALQTLRSYKPNRLICLFGCGGQRSKERRYPMGMISGTLADLTILTEDNSRNENPENIIEDIRQGVEDAGGIYKIIYNRAEAIQWAIEQAKAGDCILLAGKGHENYQEKDGIKRPFSEHEIVTYCWKKRFGVEVTQKKGEEC